MKPTKHTLKKIEHVFEQLEYTVRYEKGHFQSGYCLVENRNIVIINKFFDTEGRINALTEILLKLEMEEEQLDDKAKKTLKEVRTHFKKEEDL